MQRWTMGSVVFVLIGLLYTGSGSAHAATVKDYVVPIEAAVSDNPPKIMLSWPAEPLATKYAIQRKLYTDTTWGPVVTGPGTATGWVDTKVSVGMQYEYQITRYSTIASAMTPNLTSSGCISAGIRIPVVDHRGTVILLVDNTMATPLTAELIRLREDLIGDGWSVIRHDVSRTAAVTVVKALIKADYDAAPKEVKSVFLFGHIPVPLSGADAPGGHADKHRGAFPADTYYGEMDGVWTDTVVNITTAKAPWTACWNVPGDGKFDQSRPPSGVVELEIGRLDLSNMPAFKPKTETELLRQYLDKDHAHRHALRVLPRRALISDEIKEWGGNATAFGAWRAWTALVGNANVSEGPFSTLQTEPYLAYARFGGGDTRMCGTVFTANFATQDPKAAFFMMFGSHFSDWNYPDNILRAPLCTTTGLMSVYSGYPIWLLHRMALGGTTGEAARLTQNNRFLSTTDDITPTFGPSIYLPQTSKAGGAHITLMGDPTLRLLAVAPPTALTITKNNQNHPVLAWTASADAALGYHLYRAATPDGPFTRLTTDPVLSTTWTDTSVSAGTYTYQVKAVKLETTPGGIYLNTSQALSHTITLGTP